MLYYGFLPCHQKVILFFGTRWTIQRITQPLGYTSKGICLCKHRSRTDKHVLRIHRKHSNEHFFQIIHWRWGITWRSKSWIMTGCYWCKSIVKPYRTYPPAMHVLLFCPILQSSFKYSKVVLQLLPQWRSHHNFAIMFVGLQAVVESLWPSQYQRHKQFHDEGMLHRPAILPQWFHCPMWELFWFMFNPAQPNSDIVENTFFQQRAIYPGPNINPDAIQYR